jgi:polygalacturonase
MKQSRMLLATLLAAGTAFATDFPVADFGATGYGKTDDGAAIQKSMDAAVAAGGGSRVIFEKRCIEPLSRQIL